jgi:hypothetical protein
MKNLNVRHIELRLQPAVPRPGILSLKQSIQICHPDRSAAEGPAIFRRLHQLSKHDSANVRDKPSCTPACAEPAPSASHPCARTT